MSTWCLDPLRLDPCNPGVISAMDHYGVFGALAGFGVALSCERTCKSPLR